MKATRVSPPRATPMALSLAAFFLLPPRYPHSFQPGLASAAHVPFGYQSDSTHSWEYRNGDPPAANSPVDPSSYSGSIHYDDLHHALYATGLTYASGVFDGVDVYGMTTTEKEELLDGEPGNDGYWWDDATTGLRPHPMDPGVPDHAPKEGDCFYAVWALPGDGSARGDSPEAGRNPDGGAVELAHSRRFGSEDVPEACSAVDVLFGSPREGSLGGYLHDLVHNVPAPAAVGSEGGYVGEHPTLGFDPPDDVSPGLLDGVPIGTDTPTPAAPTPGSTDPQSRFLAMEREGGEAGEAGGDGIGSRNAAADAADGAPRGLRLPESGPHVDPVRTRSVRLLMAGHAESPDKRQGYVVGELEQGQFNQARVYAFAQQVDIRLPIGDLEKEGASNDLANEDYAYDDFLEDEYLDNNYDLDAFAKPEEELAQELEGDKNEWTAEKQEDFAKVVMSGVESRALLNDAVPPEVVTLYPVSLVVDPTSRNHYYVALLASDGEVMNTDKAMEYLNVDHTLGQGASQRSWTEFAADAEWAGDPFGAWGRPGYGFNYRVIIKKMTIESSVDDWELTDSEKVLSAQSYDGKTIAMRHVWYQEFEPDLGEGVRPAGLLFAPSGDAKGKGDVLLLAGTTAGRGSAFGTMSASEAADVPATEDLDGFVSKVRADDGNFAGHNTFDSNTNQFLNTHSMRITGDPGSNEVVAGICARPLRPVGVQKATTHIYVVGSTGAVLPGVQSDLRDKEFLESSEFAGGEVMEAFLMKIDLSVMEPVWTIQVGAFYPEGGLRLSVFGYGCAVTRDGEDVYLTGLVKDEGVVTDWSQEDADTPTLGLQANGGTDVFVSSYKTSDGSRNFLRQVGSTRDDYPSRGNGGITADRAGNAIIAGNTRGSLMRERGEGEFKYGEAGDQAASDVFIMSFDRETGDHVLAVHVNPLKKVPMPVDAPLRPISLNPPSPVSQPAPDVETIVAAGAGAAEPPDNMSVTVVTALTAFILIAAAGYALAVYKIRRAKKREADALMDVNLHGGRDGGGSNMHGHRRSTWGMRRRSKHSAAEEFAGLDIMVEVRNSASGGWHGTYDDEQLQAIDFHTPATPSNDDGNKEEDVEETLFMEEGLKEIEDSLDNYEIGELGDLGMDDVSDEDLIRAYNDAMALDIEPESSDVEFAMAGLGSGPVLDEDHKIT